MKKLLPFVLTIIIFATYIAIAPPRIFSDELDDITKQITELSKQLNDSKTATVPLESQLKSMQTQITNIKSRIGILEQDILIKKRNIDAGYKNLVKQERILNHAIRDFYIQSYYNSPILTFLSAPSASEVTQLLAYKKAATDQNKTIITNIVISVQDLETKKINLEDEQQRLSVAKADLDKQSTELDKIVQGAKKFQATLSGEIAQLSAKQQSILQSRSGSFTASIGDSELADDYNASIKGFRESAPSGSFGVFSFGGHTHRKGMSQYGARGRAQAGQDHKTILKAYYGKEPVGKDTGGNIKVSGYGEIDFEAAYLFGIAEMPSSWHMEALKAQAIAARTYAYRYKVEGKEICTTEACQVFSKSKSDSVPEAWRQAVEQTRGQVLEDVVTYYASTHGGFATPIGWDTTDGLGGGSFVEKSYDKLGGSPWIYKAWYTKGYYVSSDKCGRANPWLNSEEMADLVNAALFRDERVTPVTTSCYPGTNPYSYAELRAKSNGPSSVFSVTVIQGNGSTNEIIFQTDKGEIKLSGSDFKTAFNLRAPGYLSIPQSGFAFFNIEKK